MNKLVINQVSYSSYAFSKLRDATNEEDIEKIKNTIEEGLSSPDKIYAFVNEDISWNYKRDQMTGQSFIVGFNDLHLIFMINDEYYKLRCKYNSFFTRDGLVCEIFVQSIYSTFYKQNNGIEISIDSDFSYSNYNDFIVEMKKLEQQTGFILKFNDSADIISAIKLYDKIVTDLEKKGSISIATNEDQLINRDWVYQIDKQENNEIKTMKFGNFHYISRDDINNNIDKNTLSNKLYYLYEFLVKDFTKDNEQTLRQILRSTRLIDSSNTAEISINKNEFEEIKFVNYKIIWGDSKKNKPSRLTLIFEDQEELNYRFINIFDKLSKIKSQTILSVVKDIEMNRINNNALFQFLFNDGSFDDISQIIDWPTSNWNIEKLNEEQKIAFKLSVDSFPITFIQGPPGTGKTEIITEISKYYDSLGKNVLLSSQTNVAVENILEKLSNDDKFYNFAIKADRGKSKYNLANYKSVIEEKIKKIFSWDEVDLSGELIDSSFSKSRIVGSTTTSAALRSKDWSEFTNNIDVLIVDEISKSAVPELIRYVTKAKKIIFVGDQRQLAPLDEFEEEKLKDYDEKEKHLLNKYIQVSIFDRLFEKMKNHNRAITLKENYRSLKSICSLYSLFYDEPLHANREDNDKKYKIKWKNPQEKFIVSFINVLEATETKEGHSRKNTIEAEAIKNAINMLLMQIENVSELSLAVISTYSAQVIELRNMIHFNELANKFKSVKLDTVDAFQGDQADIVIISTVIADSTSSPGFINDYRRLNVAISRSKDLLMIFGNKGILRNISFEFLNKNKKDKYFFNDIFEIIGEKRIVNVKGVS